MAKTNPRRPGQFVQNDEEADGLFMIHGCELGPQDKCWRISGVLRVLQVIELSVGKSRRRVPHQRNHLQKNGIIRPAELTREVLGQRRI